MDSRICTGIYTEAAWSSHQYLLKPMSLYFETEVNTPPWFQPSSMNTPRSNPDSSGFQLYTITRPYISIEWVFFWCTMRASSTNGNGIRKVSRERSSCRFDCYANQITSQTVMIDNSPFKINKHVSGQRFGDVKIWKPHSRNPWKPGINRYF